MGDVLRSSSPHQYWIMPKSWLVEIIVNTLTIRLNWYLCAAMLRYSPNLKQPARRLRSTMTDSERRLWSRLRGKQLRGVQFYRQKPIGNYVVDFYAPAARLVVEVDGAQHFETSQATRDATRSVYLQNQGLRVLRFTNREELKEIDAVVAAIFTTLPPDKKSS